MKMAKEVLSRRRVTDEEKTLLGHVVVESYEIVERDTTTGKISYSKQEFKRTSVKTKTNVLW